MTEWLPTSGYEYADGPDVNKIIEFLLLAKRNTYLDSYFGGECFVGEEVVWLYENPVWSMNYAGRVIGGNFSGDFLKEVLM